MRLAAAASAPAASFRLLGLALAARAAARPGGGGSSDEAGRPRLGATALRREPPAREAGAAYGPVPH